MSEVLRMKVDRLEQAVGRLRDENERVRDYADTVDERLLALYAALVERLPGFRCEGFEAIPMGASPTGAAVEAQKTYYDPEYLLPPCECGNIPRRSKENPEVFWCVGCGAFNGDLRGL